MTATVVIATTLLTSPVFLITLLAVVVTQVDPLATEVSLPSVVPVVVVLDTTAIGMSTHATQMAVAVAITMTSLPPVTSSLTPSPELIGAGTASTSTVQTCTSRRPSTAVLVTALPHGRHMPLIWAISVVILHLSIRISMMVNSC
jgi:hypothetical protein